MVVEISKDQFIRRLETEVKKLGGPAKAGDSWNVHQTAINAAIRGERTPSPGILIGMGYESIKNINYKYRKVSL